MRHILLATTILTTLAAPAVAETVIDTKRTDQIRTATIANGGADDVRIAAAGSLTPAAGPAITIDAARKVTNEGTIQITNVDGATGILAAAGSGGGIVNTGKIIIDETYEPTDSDKDGDLDGPFAAGTGRTAIRTAGAYTGAISVGGTITVEGNDSAGVWLGGPLTGAFTHDGATTVTGDRAVGVRLDAVTGNVRIAGSVAAIGAGASAVRLDGDVAGAVVIQGVMASTGYRYTTPPTDPSKLDADDLLQGGPAVAISGNVSGGIVFAVPPKDNDPNNADEDKDGIPDASEGTAQVVSYGAAPGVQIGATNRDITVGSVAGSGTNFGLIVDGSISGRGLYAGVDATGLAVGGLGGAVTIAGGIGINGVVDAGANGASATAIRIGAGATTPEIRVAGSVSAQGGGTATSRATAIAIEAGGNVATIRNSGSIKAAATGADGSATAIVDRSGTTRLVENSGTISAGGAAATSDRNVAIDLSAATAGTTIRQTAVAAGVAAPSITGDIRFGSGDDVLDVADGKVSGNTRFGAGANRLTLSGDAVYQGNVQFGSGADQMALSGTSAFSGTADFGGGSDTLAISGTGAFSGRLANAQGLAVSVAGGTFDVKGAATIASLSVGAQGVLGVTLDRNAANATAITVAGNADFAQGAKLRLTLASITDAEGRYTVLQAGSITGAQNIASDAALLPYLYKGSIATGTGNTIAIDIARKTTGELGLNRSQAAIYDAAYKALGGDQKLAGAFLAIRDGDSFRRSIRQMLPDHAGGTFEAVTSGSRAFVRMLADPNAPFKDEGRWGYWIAQSAWGRTKSIGDTAGYDVNGWGASAGAEIKTALGNFGGSFAYLWSRDQDRGTDNEVRASQFELGAYWRGHWGGLSTLARVGAARVSFDGQRNFAGNTGTEQISREAKSDWNGTLLSATATASYELWAGNFTLRPIVSADYHRLKENGHNETGGGTAFDLILASRTSDELALNGSAALGIDFGARDEDSSWMRIEVEGGRRQLVGGSLGVTKAQFEGGQQFVLTPDQRTSGWIGRLRAVGGNAMFRLGGEAGAEQQQGKAALSLRASLQFNL